MSHKYLVKWGGGDSEVVGTLVGTYLARLDEQQGDPLDPLLLSIPHAVCVVGVGVWAAVACL